MSIIVVFDAQLHIPSSVLCPNPIPVELFLFVFPTILPQVGDHTDFVREEPPGLQCLTKTLATDVVEDVSTHLDILTVEF